MVNLDGFNYIYSFHYQITASDPGCCEVNCKDLDTDIVDIYQHDVLISNKINVTELQSFHICHALNHYLKADLLISFVNQSYCTFD